MTLHSFKVSFCALMAKLHGIALRKLPTDEHRQAWKKVERFFFVKANIGMLCLSLENLLVVSHCDTYAFIDQFMKDNQLEEQEVYDNIHKIATVTYYLVWAGEILKLLMVALSCKFRKLTDYYYIVEILCLNLKQIIRVRDAQDLHARSLIQVYIPLLQLYYS